MTGFGASQVSHIKYFVTLHIPSASYSLWTSKHICWRWVPEFNSWHSDRVRQYEKYSEGAGLVSQLAKALTTNPGRLRSNPEWGSSCVIPNTWINGIHSFAARRRHSRVSTEEWCMTVKAIQLRIHIIHPRFANAQILREYHHDASRPYKSG